MAQAVAAPISVTVLPEEKRQTVHGFGASINAWTSRLHALYYNDAFTDYVVNELGMSVFRLQMWGGISPQPIENWEDISYENFVWKSEGIRGAMNAAWAERMVERNPEVKIIGSVWSGPAWMKENNSRTGTRSGYLFDPNRDYDHDNRLREDRYMHFAKWVVEWAKFMEKQGTPFYAISLQNELMFTQWFESTLYTPEEYAKIVKITGEMFEREGVKKPLFFGPEDMSQANYNSERRHKPYIDALMQPDVRKYFDALATHGYSDGVNTDSEENPVAYWNSVKHLGLPYWITEGGTGDHDWPAPVTTGIAPRLHVALVDANVSLFTGWQLTSTKDDQSYHDFMNWDQPTGKTYAAMHFWRHVRPGAVRVENEIARELRKDVLVSSFIHEKRNELVSVLINPTDQEKQVELDWSKAPGAADWKGYMTSADKQHEAIEDLKQDSGKFLLTLPGYSIVTLVGKQGAGSN